MLSVEASRGDCLSPEERRLYTPSAQENREGGDLGFRRVTPRVPYPNGGNNEGIFGRKDHESHTCVYLYHKGGLRFIYFTYCFYLIPCIYICIYAHRQTYNNINTY